MYRSGGGSNDTQTYNNPTFTGSAGFADGTAAVPSIAWTSDADGTGTGAYRRAANCYTLSCNGVGQWEVQTGFMQMVSGMVIAWDSSTIGTAIDTNIIRASANSIQFAGSTTSAGAPTSRTEINKTVTTFTNAVAKTVLTLTIPNAAHSATYEITVCGSLGAGGAIGANEASATNKYQVTIARTAGVNAAAAISAAYGAAAAAVAGAATVTCTAALAAVSGAVGATNTIDIQATISRSGGSSDNHTCVATATLLNANVTGVTIA